MPKANDLHHLAISTADIKTQIEFFSDVLGMELVALYWMHGVDGCFHAFLKLHDTASVAFVQTPDNHKIEPQIGVSHAGNPTASWTMFSCSSFNRCWSYEIGNVEKTEFGNCDAAKSRSSGTPSKRKA